MPVEIVRIVETELPDESVTWLVLRVAAGP